MTADRIETQSEQELERDIGTVHQAFTGLEQPTPPDLLDRAVLNLARRELAERGESAGKRYSVKWLGAFATAAVVVLALTVTLEQQQQAPLPAREEADGIRIDSDSTTVTKDELRVQSKSTGPIGQKASRQLSSEPVAASPAAQESLADEAAERLMPPEKNLAAEAWIKELLRLKQSGHAARLAEELAAFRAAYPDYQLPPELVD